MMEGKYMKILIVDDEENILEIVEAYLVAKNYQVFRAMDGEEALRKAETIRPDLIVLDLMLPDISGLEVCRRIRKSSSVPVIMLTARTTEQDILSGLQIGADHYMTKPFSPKELVARVQTVLRRSHPEPQEVKWSFEGGLLEIYPDNKQVFKKGVEVGLTPTEYRLLTLLASHPQQIFPRQQLLQVVKGLDFDGTDRVIDVHIKNLRQKIEDDDTRTPYYILTIYGEGYRFGGQK
ncbi:MAG: response regulator transcription factor [Methanothrix sp.]|jgi:two-component system alkaline phosphatase synthesis response regulator PhoP|nr:response regulator transcription factor [Methanothrix sp.]